MYSKNVADKSIDETFHKLLNSSSIMYDFIKTFEKFDEFEKNMKNNIENLNSAYINSKNLIKKNEYEEEIELLVTNKLDYLNNLTSDYYNQINKNYNELKNYLKLSIQEIDVLLNLCANKTFSVFADEYYIISNSTQNKFDEQEEEENEKFIKEKSLTQNNQFYIDAQLVNLKKKANFKFEFNFDEINNLKMPKVYAHVINLSRPKKINMEIYSNIDDCMRNVEAYEIEFNNVNYTLFLDFNTDSNDIIITVDTDFDAYQYSVERYLSGDSVQGCKEEENSFIFGCFIEDNSCISSKEQILEKTYKNVERKVYTDVIHIPN